MTTIAYRDGILAADTAYSIGWIYDGRAPKIVKMTDGRLAGATGVAAFMGAWHRWCLGGCEGSQPQPRIDKEDGSDLGFIIELDGSISVFEEGGSFRVNPAYWTIGSGRGIALGALYMGADPETAVRAAIEHDTGTRGSITVLRLGA